MQTMTDIDYPKFPTRQGYMTETIQRGFIASAIAQNMLPKDAHRMVQILSLTASSDLSKPIHFWQLYSVLGQDPIVRIVQNFYERVFADEDWFKSVFERVGGIGHHINTQTAMWIDVMGGGPYYHGAEFRLNFHHTHNAISLMDEKGAERWATLMRAALDDSTDVMGNDPRIRPSLNTFLSYFMTKYAEQFSFENRHFFGEVNPPVKRKINFMNMTAEAIEALDEAELKTALQDRGVDVSPFQDKAALVGKALML